MHDYIFKRHLPLSDPGMYLGPAETHARQETERAVAARLAALDLLDSSQRRPTPKPSIFNCVNYIDL